MMSNFLDFIPAQVTLNGTETLTNKTLTSPDINGGTLDGATVGATTPAAGTFTSLTDSGNLNFTGTGNRITGDFNNGTQANRVLFQSNITNDATLVGVVPNGTSKTSGFDSYTGTTANESFLSMRLAVSGTEARIQSGTIGSGTFLPLTMFTGGSERMRIDTNGNVGIGLTNPSLFRGSFGGGFSQALALGTSATLTGEATYSGYGGALAGALNIYQNSGNGFLRYLDVGVFGDANSGGAGSIMRFLTQQTGVSSLTERMRIDTAGNVGIGNSSPSTYGKLAFGLFGSAGTNNIIGIHQAAAVDNVALRIAGFNFANQPQTSIDFIQNSASNFQSQITFNNNAGGGIQERMRIDSSGSVIVGATTTGAFFDGNLNVFKSNNIAMCVKISTVGSPAMSVWSDPTSGDNSFALFGTESSFTVRGSISYNRTAGLTAYNTTSDQRLKENITDSLSALSKIDSVKIRSFDWKETGNHVDFGVIAQELIQVAPECVTKGQDNEDGTIKNAWAVDTSALVPALVKAIQEQQALIENLTTRLIALEGN